MHYYTIKAIKPLLLAFGYPVMFVGSIVEGPALMILVGFLLRIGLFSFIPAFFLLWLGDLAGDFLWYSIGRYGRHQTIVRIGKFFDVSEKMIDKIKEKFRRHEGKIIFVSKLTTGFGFSVFIVMAAGMLRTPIKKFSALASIGGMIWTIGLLAIGYFFGNIYTQLEKDFRIIFLAILAAIIAAALYGFGRFMRKVFLGINSKQNEN